MAKNVYIWPMIASQASYGDQFRVVAEEGIDGVLLDGTESFPRVPVRLGGPIDRLSYAPLAIFLNRMRGGLGVAGLIDLDMRRRFGWDVIPAVDPTGAEFWTIGGGTAAYAGQPSAPPGGPWRSIFGQATATAAAGATTVTVGQLLAGETLPCGCVVRFGDWRYVLTADATADGAGVATLQLDQGLRTALAVSDPVRAPGDFMLAKMRPRPRRTPVNAFGQGTFEIEFVEAYPHEIKGGIGSYVSP